jgi:hypothetical protein
MHKIFLTILWVLVSTSVAHSQSISQFDLSKKPDLPRIPPPTEREFLEAFGARIVAQKAIFRSTPPSGETLIKKNLLIGYGISPDLRAKIYESTACGSRDFEMIVAKKNSAEAFGTLFPCDDRCFGLAEKIVEGKLIGVSRPITLPKQFCEGLWTNVVRVIDEDGP